MAGVTNTAAANLAAALAAEVAGLRGASATPLDTLPGTPYAVVGAPKGNVTPGSWEIIEYIFPVDFLISRTVSEARDQVACNDLLDLVMVSLRTGISLSGAVAYILPGNFDTNTFYTIGSEAYQSVRMELTAAIVTGQTYTP